MPGDCTIAQPRAIGRRSPPISGKDRRMPHPFTIYVMQSAHTDIGYTHPQEQIALMYLEHYDRVLELCRKTADAPEPQRFKWVCETFWQARHYLSHRPER